MAYTWSSVVLTLQRSNHRRLEQEIQNRLRVSNVEPSEQFNINMTEIPGSDYTISRQRMLSTSTTCTVQFSIYVQTIICTIK